MELRQALILSTAMLASAKVDAPRLCAQLLAAHALRCSRLDLILNDARRLTTEENAALQDLVRRRATGEPTAYILGRREFYGRDFMVTPATLIPRPETEHLVEAALAGCPQDRLRFVDMGTGSGCLGVTLAAERRSWRGCMLDISEAALTVACSNAQRHGVQARLHAIRGDLCAPPLAEATFDLVVSNPPYVSAEEYTALSPEVKNFEPASALVPDASGLSHIRALARTAARLLRPRGLCLVEHGYAQGAGVREIFRATGLWTDLETQKDWARHDRFCCCRRA